MKTFDFLGCIVLLAAYVAFISPTKLIPKLNMKFFNAIQIALIIALGPILIPLLKTATFFGAGPLMCILGVIYVGMFIWNIFMITDSISS